MKSMGGKLGEKSALSFNLSCILDLRIQNAFLFAKSFFAKFFRKPSQVYLRRVNKRNDTLIIAYRDCAPFFIPILCGLPRFHDPTCIILQTILFHHPKIIVGGTSPNKGRYEPPESQSIAFRSLSRESNGSRKCKCFDLRTKRIDKRTTKDSTRNFLLPFSYISDFKIRPPTKRKITRLAGRRIVPTRIIIYD